MIWTRVTFRWMFYHDGFSAAVGVKPSKWLYALYLFPLTWEFPEDKSAFTFLSSSFKMRLIVLCLVLLKATTDGTRDREVVFVLNCWFKKFNWINEGRETDECELVLSLTFTGKCRRNLTVKPNYLDRPLVAGCSIELEIRYVFIHHNYTLIVFSYIHWSTLFTDKKAIGMWCVAIVTVSFTNIKKFLISLKKSQNVKMLVVHVRRIMGIVVSADVWVRWEESVSSCLNLNKDERQTNISC